MLIRRAAARRAGRASGGDWLRQAQIFCGVVRGNRPAHRLRDRDLIHERARLLRRLEWIIGGKHYALVAERGDGAIERFGRTHAGCRDDEIVLEILRRRLAELDRIKIRSGAAVEAPEQERQRLAEMAEADA